MKCDGRSWHQHALRVRHFAASLTTFLALSACSFDTSRLRGTRAGTDGAMTIDAGASVDGQRQAQDVAAAQDFPTTQDMRPTDSLSNPGPPDAAPDRPDPCLGRLDGIPCGTSTCDTVAGTLARAITVSYCRGGVCVTTFVYCQGLCGSMYPGFAGYRSAHCVPAISGGTATCSYDGGVVDGGTKTCSGPRCGYTPIPNCPAQMPNCTAASCLP